MRAATRSARAAQLEDARDASPEAAVLPARGTVCAFPLRHHGARFGLDRARSGAVVEIEENQRSNQIAVSDVGRVDLDASEETAAAQHDLASDPLTRNQRTDQPSADQMQRQADTEAGDGDGLAGARR